MRRRGAGLVSSMSRTLSAHVPVLLRYLVRKLAEHDLGELNAEPLGHEGGELGMGAASEKLNAVVHHFGPRLARQPERNAPPEGALSPWPWAPGTPRPPCRIPTLRVRRGGVQPGRSEGHRRSPRGFDAARGPWCELPLQLLISERARATATLSADSAAYLAPAAAAAQCASAAAEHAALQHRQRPASSLPPSGSASARLPRGRRPWRADSSRLVHTPASKRRTSSPSSRRSR